LFMSGIFPEKSLAKLSLYREWGIFAKTIRTQDNVWMFVQQKH